MSIKKNIENINKDIKNSDILLVAVTKMVDIDKATEAIEAGCTDIGENRVQEFNHKYESLGEHTRFHLIGHLQRNKVKYIIGKCTLIHSVDSISLLQEIEKQCERLNVTQDILLQVNIAHEQSKFGLDKEQVLEIIKQNESNKYVKIKGLMTIAPYSKDPEEIRWVFRELYQLFIDIKSKTFYNTSMELVSMGMSNDYKIAIEEGANIIRVGSKIFNI